MSLMSNWLDPDCARAAIATATPATGTGSAVDAALDAVDPAAFDGVVAAKAVKPRIRHAGDVRFRGAAAVLRFAVSDADVAETSVARALA